MKTNLTDYFTKYQKLWINDENDLKLADKARQVGFTHAASYRVIDKLLEVPERNWWWVPRDEKSGKMFINDCRIWCKTLNIAAKGLEFEPNVYNLPVINSVNKNYVSAYMNLDRFCQVMLITLPNLSRVHVLSSNPFAAAGKSGYVTIDEFDLHEDQEQLYGVVMPIITWGGSLELMSTHESPQSSLFCRFISDIQSGNEQNWSYHHVDINEAVAQGIVEKINRRRTINKKEPLTHEQFLKGCRSRCIDEEMWQMKYLCQPASDRQSLIPWEWVERACRDDLHRDKPTKPCYLGFDVGRSRDLSVISIGELDGHVLKVRELVTMADTKYDEQERRLDELINIWRPTKIAIDGSTRGGMLGERLKERHGEVRVSVFNMAGKPQQEEVATQLHAYFDRQRIQIPNDKTLKRDIHRVQKEVSEGGVIRYRAPATKDGHSDRFWSLGLMCTAAGNATPGMVMTSRLNTKSTTATKPIEDGAAMARAEDALATYSQVNDPFGGY